MKCSNPKCLSILTMADEVHVTGENRPRYYHSFCVGNEKIDHVIPVKVKEFRHDNRRCTDTKGKVERPKD